MEMLQNVQRLNVYTYIYIHTCTNMCIYIHIYMEMLRSVQRLNVNTYICIYLFTNTSKYTHICIEILKSQLSVEFAPDMK